MLLINWKAELKPIWKKECVLPTYASNALLTITASELYVPVVTLGLYDNKKLPQLINKSFRVQFIEIKKR